MSSPKAIGLSRYGDNIEGPNTPSVVVEPVPIMLRDGSTRCPDILKGLDQ